MSSQYLRVYLDPNKLPVKDLATSEEPGGRPYIDVASCEWLGPKITDAMAEVSLSVRFAQTARREPGIYKHDSAVGAKGTLDEDLCNGRSGYELRITAPTIVAAVTLRDLVRTGAIRPTESYEGSQTGKSRVELGAELKQTQAELAEYKGNLTALKDHLRIFRHNLRRLRWPWSCRTPP